jgi:nitrite reductase/ring-hydroxylating ferredoxin subunit/uncharacterized membrane protein
MRSSAHFHGHPIHPMLVGFPIAYLCGSTCLDVAGRIANRPEWHATARQMNTLGLGSALLAAVPGFVDYTFAVPPASSARRRATSHMFANLSALALFAVARVGRRSGARPSALAIAAEACGTALMTAAGWMGGTLVYRNQIAVDHRYADAGKWRFDAVVPDGQEKGEAINVAADDELAVDQMKLLRIGSRRVVLARTEQGYVAFDDRCTHKGGPLSDGALICGTVQCPWHGSQFDVHSGVVKHGPARDNITCYEIETREGRLFVHLPPKQAEQPSRGKGQTSRDAGLTAPGL